MLSLTEFFFQDVNDHWELLKNFVRQTAETTITKNEDYRQMEIGDRRHLKINERKEKQQK